MSWDTLTSSAEDSPAKTSAPLGIGSVLQAHEVASGLSTIGSFANYDRTMSLWKTWQHSLFGGLTAFSATWPRAGMTRNGIAFLHRPLVRLIDVTGSSFWPTPQVSMIHAEHYTLPTSYRHWQEGRQVHLTQVLRDSRMWPDRAVTVLLPVTPGGQASPRWIEWLMGFPDDWTDLEDSGMPSSRK